MIYFLYLCTYETTYSSVFCRLQKKSSHDIRLINVTLIPSCSRLPYKFIFTGKKIRIFRISYVKTTQQLLFLWVYRCASTGNCYKYFDGYRLIQNHYCPILNKYTLLNCFTFYYIRFVLLNLYESVSTFLYSFVS